MARTIEDMAPRLKEAREKKRQEHLFNLREQKKVGETMAQLIQDERWHLYVSHIETVKARYEESLKLIERKLLDGTFLDSTQYGQQKMSQIAYKARIEAFDFVWKLAETLVNRGEKAAEELALEERPLDKESQKA